jgi:hypothetical protein
MGGVSASTGSDVKPVSAELWKAQETATNFSSLSAKITGMEDKNRKIVNLKGCLPIFDMKNADLVI